MDPVDRERIITALRNIAPTHPVTRVWGRLETATPEQAAEGNGWAADIEDLADIILRAIEDPDDVQCWHTEPGTPCDWHTCRQPDHLARGDKGTDPAHH
ncbi:hypothetical protein ACFV0R_19020 [Streptomyces sp. NPDC059578]|uniref:hypothetical protein n=1 Tax=Streptomyces sp. NPDC059578 TaxID=3346874 RepID=UPI0036952F37